MNKYIIVYFLIDNDNKTVYAHKMLSKSMIDCYLIFIKDNEIANRKVEVLQITKIGTYEKV